MWPFAKKLYHGWISTMTSSNEISCKLFHPEMKSWLRPCLTLHTYQNIKSWALIISFLSVFDMQNKISLCACAHGVKSEISLDTVSKMIWYIENWKQLYYYTSIDKVSRNDLFEKHFPGTKWVKFCTNSELREKTFSNFKIQRSKHPCAPFRTTMQTRILCIAHKGKPRSSRNKLTRLPHKLGLCNRNPNLSLRLRLWM